MPRRVQDIIPGNKRTIRDVPVARPTKREPLNRDVEEIKIRREYKPEPKIVEADIPATEIENVDSSIVKHVEKPRQRKKKSKFPWILLTLGTIVLFAGVAYGLSGHFAKATFSLVPKIVPVHVSGTYMIPSNSSSTFGYELITETATASTTIPATLGKYTETKAQGSVTVYNSYSSQPQRMVAGSRIVGNSGLVYRLTSSIVIPGYKPNGKIIVPGSITANIVAENVGEQYNISSSDSISDFKFIAYKGTPKYSGFYARLTTSVSGGFAGKKTVISPTLLASSSADLQNKLSQDIQHKLFNMVPDGYVMYPGIFTTVSDNPVITNTDAKSATITMTTNVYGAIFKKINFAKFLAGASSSNLFGSFDFDANDIDSLSVVPANIKDFSPIKKTNLVVKIGGSFDLIGNIPRATLAKSLAGTSLSKTTELLKKYVNVIDIPHSSVEMLPPWVTIVPTDTNRIIINIKTP